MKFLMGIMLCLMSTVALADDCDFSRKDLTDNQKSILTQACQLSNANALSTVERIATPENVTKFGQVAQEFTKAIGSAAKEMNVAANDFLDTPAGKLTAVVILWKVMGDEAGAVVNYFASFIVGSLLLTLIWTLICKARNVVYIPTIEYGLRPHFWGLFNTRYVTKVTRIAKDRDEESANITIGVLYAIGFILTLIIGFNLLIP